MNPAAAPSNSQFPQHVGVERLGRHEVLLRLGAGGMATVYLARAVAEGGFERLAALKVLHPHLLGEREFLAMFLDEARVAARIHHPNVVAIQDLGVEDERMFTVMDYVLGDTLAAAQQAAIKLRRGLPLGIVLRVGLDALRGLDAAHELVDVHGRPLQVVHRDATPHNILLGVDGVSRVTDFGIAKAESRISFTGVGTLKGKAPYMAPEQFSNRRVDRRVDIFSMAVTIWEALALRRCLPPDLAHPTRRPPYRPLGTILRDVPPELDAVLSRGLKLNPDERWRTAGEFADAIERQLRDHIAPHKAVATFVRAFAHAKVERERDAIRDAERRAQPAPRAITSLRGQSGFQHATGTRAPLVSEPLPEPQQPLSHDELEPPTRVMAPKPSRPPARAATPRGGSALVPAPPTRPRLTPIEAPGNGSDRSGTRAAFRGETLLGTGVPASRGLIAPAPSEPASDAPEALDAADAASLDEAPAPEEVFISIPPPSVAPSVSAPAVQATPHARTVLDPDRTSKMASVQTPAALSLIDPAIPRAPKLPDVAVATAIEEAIAEAEAEAETETGTETGTEIGTGTGTETETETETGTSTERETTAAPAASAEPSAQPAQQHAPNAGERPHSMVWSVGFSAALLTTVAALWAMLAR